MIKPLEYHFDDGSHVIFNKYTIDTSGVIRNKRTGAIRCTYKTGEYNSVGVYDIDGRQRGIIVGRALLSTFQGPPPSAEHTADHIDRNPNNDTIGNLRWLCKKGQNANQVRPETQKSAFVIVKGGDEKTAGEWADDQSKDANTIRNYARNKQNGFSYKEYPDLPGETWKKISESYTMFSHWEISDMNRVKYITKHAENVLSGDRLGIDNRYPTIKINGKQRRCHILSFMTFFPEEYAKKKIDEVVMHDNDDKLDFRPSNLSLGTSSENAVGARDNGKYDGKKTDRMKCASYINDVFEKEYDSQTEAVKYLKYTGWENASHVNIIKVLNGTRKIAYGRTWKKI